MSTVLAIVGATSFFLMRFYFRPYGKIIPCTSIESNPSSSSITQDRIEKLEHSSYPRLSLVRPAYQLLLLIRSGGDKFPSDSTIRAEKRKMYQWRRDHLDPPPTITNATIPSCCWIKRDPTTRGQKFEKNSRFLSRLERADVAYTSQYYLRARGAHRSRPPSSFSFSIPPPPFLFRVPSRRRWNRGFVP